MGNPTPIGEQDGFLGRRDIPGVLDIEGKPVLASVAQRGQADSPRLEVVASGDHVSVRAKHAVVLACLVNGVACQQPEHNNALALKVH